MEFDNMTDEKDSARHIEQERKPPQDAGSHKGLPHPFLPPLNEGLELMRDSNC
jgi:hypothetical protein